MIGRKIFYIFLKADSWLTGKSYKEGSDAAIEEKVVSALNKEKKNILLIVFASALFSFAGVYIAGSVHHDRMERDIAIEPPGDFGSLQDALVKDIQTAIDTENYKTLEKKLLPYKNRLGVMVFGKGKLHIDTHAGYEIIQYGKRLYYFEQIKEYYTYEVSIYSLERKSWNRRYKRWTINFFKSFRAGHRYHYLTVWYGYFYVFWSVLFSGILFRIRNSHISVGKNSEG